LLGVFYHRLSSVIFSVDSGTTRNVIVDLSSTAIIFTQMLVSVDSLVEEEKINLRLDVKEELFFQTWGHMSSDLGLKISSDSFQSFFSDQRARSMVSHKVLGLKDKFWVISEISSMSTAISRISL